MDNLLRRVLIIIMIASFSSCAMDNNSLDEDVASLYVGNWTNDYNLAKTNDYNDVRIERLNDNEIVMINFFNLGEETTFRVEVNNLEITTKEVNGFAVSGEGTSNYSYDKITIYYSFDGDEYESLLTR